MPRAALIAVLLALALPLAGCQSQAEPPAATATAPAPAPVAGTAPASSPIASSVGPERPQTQEACTAAGGRWEKGGLAGVVQCFLEHPDAGKACTGATDCQGLCLAPSDGPPRCQGTYPLFGCVRFLDAEGHRVGICID